MNLQGRIAVVAAGLLTGVLIFAEQGLEAASSGPQEGGAKNLLTNTEIRKLQSALAAAGFDAGPADGLWGDTTDRALRNFQRSKEMEITGQPDEETLLALGLRLKAPPALEPAYVRQVQRALNRAGYSVGSVDGAWGPATEAALRNFQRAKGLEPTGKLNKDSAPALGLSPVETNSEEFQEKSRDKKRETQRPQPQ